MGQTFLEYGYNNMFIEHGTRLTHELTGYINLKYATEIYTSEIDFIPCEEPKMVKRIAADKKIAIVVVLNDNKGDSYILKDVYDTSEEANKALSKLMSQIGMINI